MRSDRVLGVMASVLIGYASTTATASGSEPAEATEVELAKRFASWVGEPVVFTSTCYDSARRRRVELEGKRGVIAASRMIGLNQEITITIDGTTDSVTVDNKLCFGFRAEEAALSKMIGREYWTKGYLDGVTPSPRPLTHLVADRVEWQTNAIHDLALVFKTDAGQEVQLTMRPFRDCIEPRFCARRESVWDPSIELFDRNPRTLHSAWSTDIWKLIEQGIVAVGMDPSMVAATCGGRMEAIGGVISDSGAVSTRYRCNGYDFLLGKKVTKSDKIN